jgi:hypothetical protein
MISAQKDSPSSAIFIAYTTQKGYSKAYTFALKIMKVIQTEEWKPLIESEQDTAIRASSSACLLPK